MHASRLRNLTGFHFFVGKRTGRNRAGAVRLALVASLMWGSEALATWIELGDAPEGVATYQNTTGSGPLSSIRGSIDTVGTVADDHVDTYAITITDPDNFWASTTLALGGFANGGSEDSRLWLWTQDGLPLLGNDDIGSSVQSTLSSPGIFNSLTGGAVDSSASGIALVAGETYLLSISFYPNAPVDALGNDLFNLDNQYQHLLGPIPTAGPMVGWKNTWQEGFAYDIALNGASYAIPEPSSIAILIVGVLGLRLGHRLTRRPRRPNS